MHPWARPNEIQGGVLAKAGWKAGPWDNPGMALNGNNVVWKKPKQYLGELAEETLRKQMARQSRQRAMLQELVCGLYQRSAELR